MQRYVNQVIEDLKLAKKNVPPEPDFGEDYEGFEEKMFALETVPDLPMKKLFGVSYEELPPFTMLTDKQANQLLEAVVDTWKVFNIVVDFPDGLPLKLKYELVRDEFIKDIHYMPGWSMHFDFCDGWCPECKIVDYCNSVYETWSKDELDEEPKKVRKSKA